MVSRTEHLVRLLRRVCHWHAAFDGRTPHRPRRCEAAVRRETRRVEGCVTRGHPLGAGVAAARSKVSLGSSELIRPGCGVQRILPGGRARRRRTCHRAMYPSTPPHNMRACVPDHGCQRRVHRRARSLVPATRTWSPLQRTHFAHGAGRTQPDSRRAVAVGYRTGESGIPYQRADTQWRRCGLDDVVRDEILGRRLALNRGPRRSPHPC